MDRWPALVALEWRRLLCREAPSLALRRPRPRDPADSPDTRCAPVSRLAKAPNSSPANDPTPSSTIGRPTAALHHVLRARAQGHTDAEFLHPAADVVCRHAEDAGHRQHRRQPAHDAQCYRRMLVRGIAEPLRRPTNSAL